MKLEIRMADGDPVIFFIDDLSEDKSIPCYSKKDSHDYTTRGYMRRLRKPETESDIRKSWNLLIEYAKII